MEAEIVFDGINMNPGTLPLLSGAVTRSISAENFTGKKGGGGRTTTGAGEKGARGLGQKWKVSPCVNIPPGETFTLAQIEGPGAVQSMWIAGHVTRDLIIRIYWDGQDYPSVECPLPDFFGCGWFDNTAGSPCDGPFSQLNSLMVAVNPNRALNCFWLMPFKSNCRITMENRSTTSDRMCFYQINYTLTSIPEDAAHFHAQFRAATPNLFGEDFTIVDGVIGRGHYVGTALQVGLNGLGKWWGEGEVKFFMDGDGEFPTICGTGTEDYFLGSFDWEVSGQYMPYSSPYGGMFYLEKPDGLYKSQQRFSMYRWHVVDPIRFEKNLKVTMQDLGWRSDGRYLPRRDDFYATSFWYQELPAAIFPTLPLPDEIAVT